MRLDVHKRVCQGAMMDETDAIIKQGRFSNDLRSLDALLGDVDGDKAVLEAEELLATPLRPVRGGGATTCG